MVDCTVTPVSRPREPSLDPVAPNTEMSDVPIPKSTGAFDTRESRAQTIQDTSTVADEGLPLPFEIPSTVGSEPVLEDASSALSELPCEPVVAAGGETDIGRRFVAWLTQNIRDGRVDINTPRARLHVLTEGLALVTPGIFRDFSPEHWERAQKRFQKLKIHKKTAKDTNVWKCQVAKERKRSIIRVMVIADAEKSLAVALPAPNPATTLVVET